jgi:hypothetical protein
MSSPSARVAGNRYMRANAYAYQPAKETLGGIWSKLVEKGKNCLERLSNSGEHLICLQARLNAPPECERAKDSFG